MPVKRQRLTESERERFKRHLVLPEMSEAGQLRLLSSRVLIVGVGALGSAAVVYLTACGIGEIGIADDDRVELSNLPRQVLYGEADVGEEKTFCAQRGMRRLRSATKVNVYPFRITESNARDIIGSYDFVIDATDNFESRFVINDACVGLRKSFSHAGILGMYGQTMTVVPGAGPCFRCVFQEVPPPGAVESTEHAGVLGSVAGIMGTLQATEAIKYLVKKGELLVGRLLTLDALTMHFREIELPQQSRCAVCRHSQAGKTRALALHNEDMAGCTDER
jgi:molybdopterin/thiamine biosynthesis adenylyltransferase